MNRSSAAPSRDESYVHAPVTGASEAIPVWPAVRANTGPIALHDEPSFEVKQAFGSIPPGVYTSNGKRPSTSTESDPGGNPEPRTEGNFRHLARTAPERLAALVRSGNLRNSQLTFAAEAVGSMANTALADALLEPLVTHASALVREGVVYGLARLATERAMNLLRQMAERDPTPCVRRAASESLEDL